MIAILLLLREYTPEEVTTAIAWGLDLQMFSCDIIAYLIREHRGEIPSGEQLTLHNNQSALAEVTTSLQQYDQLLSTKGELH